MNFPPTVSPTQELKNDFKAEYRRVKILELILLQIWVKFISVGIHKIPGIKPNDANRKGYSYVGDIVMLVTYSWWQFYNVGDRNKILVTSFGCWCPTLMLRDRGCWCHQHISSPTSVTDIDVDFTPTPVV